MRRLRLSEKETKRRYVEGAIISALRLYRHWRKRGLTSDEAFSRAVKQAVGMIEVSGLNKDEVLEALNDFKRIVDAVMDEFRKRNERKGSS